jgi:hypothetical protein
MCYGFFFEKNPYVLCNPMTGTRKSACLISVSTSVMLTFFLRAVRSAATVERRQDLVPEKISKSGTARSSKDVGEQANLPLPWHERQQRSAAHLRRSVLRPIRSASMEMESGAAD